MEIHALKIRWSWNQTVLSLIWGSYTGKTTSLYWDGPQIILFEQILSTSSVLSSSVCSRLRVKWINWNNGITSKYGFMLNYGRRRDNTSTPIWSTHESGAHGHRWCPSLFYLYTVFLPLLHLSSLYDDVNESYGGLTVCLKPRKLHIRYWIIL